MQAAQLTCSTVADITGISIRTEVVSITVCDAFVTAAWTNRAALARYWHRILARNVALYLHAGHQAPGALARYAWVDR